MTNYIKKHMSCAVELMEDEQYAPGLIDSILSDQFGRDWASTTEIGADGLVRFAMGGLLQYLHDTQIKGVGRLKTVIRYTEAQYMHLPGVTRSNLELTETMRGREKRGTLLWVLDKTSTAMGKRLLRSWLEQPLVSSEIINHRLNAVECLVKHTVDPGRDVRGPALHHRHRAPDDTDRLWLRHPQRDLHHGSDLRPAA